MVSVCPQQSCSARGETFRMSCHATGFQEPQQFDPPSTPLPPDHVLGSGAVTFPGVFDQHGCPLVVFPAGGQDRLSELSKAEVVDFIHYFQNLHNKTQETSRLVSVVADLRDSPPPATRFIAETLLLLELHRQTLHSVYILLPRKRDAAKTLQKLLAPPRFSCVSFRKILLREIPELFNYIDRSQLPAALGGYFRFCHRSWVGFVKDIDAFLQEFLSVVQRLPACISTLQQLSRLPLPSSISQLQLFCCTNEAKFLQLRRDLGLDELLRRCEGVLEKLRDPDRDPCYQNMAGTPLFTHTASDMLQSHSRITAAVEKVELLWQQAFSKAHLQLQVFQLRSEAQQISRRMEVLQEQLQRYQLEISREAAGAERLLAEFQTSLHTPAMALVRCADDVVHTLAEILPAENLSGEFWVLDLQRLKEDVYSAAHFLLQTLRTVSTFHHYCSKADRWNNLVLHENFLQELLTGVQGDAGGPRKTWGAPPAWRWRLSSFLKMSPPPEPEELLHLSNLSTAVPDQEVQQRGRQVSQRCMTLRKLLLSPGPVSVEQLQLALHWQYQLLLSNRLHPPSDAAADERTADDVLRPSESRISPSPAPPGVVPAQCRPPSLGSFDSGFDGAASGPLEAGEGKEGALWRPAGSGGSQRAPPTLHLVQENISSMSDGEDQRDLGSGGVSSRASIQIIPTVEVDALNVEIKVTRSAAPPSNPWLSLPVDDLEDSYTVTITQNPSPRQRERQLRHAAANQPTQPEERCLGPGGSRSPGPGGSRSPDWTPPSHRILSSTLHEADQSTTEGAPTLLWDSYDLHDQEPDAVDGATGWEAKEQAGLRAVERILDRTEDILEEEEQVLAQEAVLDALLTLEDGRGAWPLWDGEDRHDATMSSSELAEAGVLVLDESFSSGGSDPGSAGSVADDERSLQVRTDLLEELRKLRLLDELIMEEKLQIHKLRSGSGSPAPPEMTHLEDEPVDKHLEEIKHLEDEPEDEHLEDEHLEDEPVDKHLEDEPVDKHLEDEPVDKHLEDEPADKHLEDEPADKHLEDEPADKHLEDEHLEDEPADKHLEDEHLEDEPVDKHLEDEPVDKHLEDEPVDKHLEDEPADKHLEDEPADKHLEDEPADKHLEDEPVGKHLEDEPADKHLEDEPADKHLEDEPVGKHLEDEPVGKHLEDEPVGKHLEDEHLEDEPVDKHLEDEPADKHLEDEPADKHLEDEPVDKHLEDEPITECEKWWDSCRVVPTQTGVKEELWSSQSRPAEGKNSVCERKDLNRSCDPRRASEGGVSPGEGAFDPGGSITPPPSATKKEEMNPDCLVFNLNVNESRNNNNNNGSGPESWGASLGNLRQVTHGDAAAGVPARTKISPPRIGPGSEPGGRELREDPSDCTRTSRCGTQGMQTQRHGSDGEMADFKTAIVLDTGSGLMKAGFADQERPNVMFPTIIGMPKYEEIMNGNLQRETYIGLDAQQMRGVLALKHPIKNGIVRNWDEMEKIWHYTFQQLSVDPEDHPVLLTEAAMNPLENRQRMVELMFECFSVPLTYVAMQAVLALYAAGRTSGVVFDSGDGVSHSVPVFEGYCLPHAVQRFPLAGLDVTTQLKKLLQEQGVCMRTTAEQEIVREMKETCCCVALNYEAELHQGGASCGEMCYSLPDGQTVTLCTERFRAPEILFQPQLIGRDHYGMHESIFKSVLRSDLDLRRCFLGNIVLSGGNTLLPGLPERLQAEITALVPAAGGGQVRVTSPRDRDFLVWRGGAVLANLPTFSSAWISQGEYEEFGPQIVFRKCF